LVVDAERERLQAAVLVEALDANPARQIPLRDSLTKPGDAMGLRGIPAIARGVSGVSPGTDPLRAAIRSDERADRLRLG